MNVGKFLPPTRTLLGPGPSDVAPSVLEAMSQPVVGHLDPSFISMMDEIKVMPRAVMLTENQMTFPVSGTGSAGMEFCFVNLIEPGDKVIVGINGVFGTRMADVAERCGAIITVAAITGVGGGRAECASTRNWFGKICSPMRNRRR